MRPLTDHIAKAIIPVAGKSLLQRTAEGLARAGIRDITIGLGWLHEGVEEASTSIDWPARTTLVNVPSYGRGPLETLVTTSAQMDADNVLVTPVDAILSPDDMAGLIKAHRNGLVLAVDFASSTGSRIYADSDGMLVGLEDPIKPFSKEGRSAMVFAAGAEFLERCRSALSQGHSRVLTVINQMIREGSIARVFPISHQWFDLDTIQDLIHANSYLLKENVPQASGHIFIPENDAMEIGEEITTGTAIRLAKGVHLDGPVLLAPGCHLGSDSRVGPDVYLDRNTRVGSGCHLARMVASGESIIPDGKSIAGAVVFCSEVHYGGGFDSK